MLKIEVAAGLARGVRSPRIGLLLPVRCTVSGTVPLRLSGQRFPRPACVRAGFRMTHVYRTIHGKRNFLKHSREVPDSCVIAPKARMGDVVLRLPIPALPGPEVGILIAAGCKEFQILLVRDRELIDGKSRHFNRVLFVFVVPPETARILTTQAQGGQSSG